MAGRIESLPFQKPPFSATWYCTNRCNLSCTHCPFPYLPKEKQLEELGTEEAKLMIQDIAQSDVYMLSFAGGEPFLRSDLIELATFAREQGMTIQVSTNGLFIESITPPNLKAAGFKCIQISLDGISQEVHEEIRGKNTYLRTMEAIRQCVKHDLPVILAIAVSKRNMGELKHLKNFLKKEKVSMVKVQPVLTLFGSNDDKLTVTEVRDLISVLNNEFALEDISLSFTYQALSAISELKNYHCNSDLKKAVIFSNGSIGLCDMDEQSAIGNVIENKFIPSWQSLVNQRKGYVNCGCSTST